MLTQRAVTPNLALNTARPARLLGFEQTAHTTGEGADAPQSKYAHNALGQRVFKTERR
ncbi:MAG: hypothetical protein IV104_14525 [Acidovorax sp.]|nr:hypothetical protein [Acidovorax sp.]